MHFTPSLCRLTDKQWGEQHCVSNTQFVHTEQTGSVEGEQGVHLTLSLGLTSSGANRQAVGRRALCVPYSVCTH